MTRFTIVLVTSVAIVTSAYGQLQNEITQTNGDLILGTHYNIDQFAKEVEIIDVIPGEILEFRARLLDNGEYVGPGDINLIAVDPGASGLVRISLVDEEHPVGVRDVKQMDLTGPNVTGILEYASIAEDVGEDGPVVINQAVGSVSVGGNWVNTLQADEITAPIVIRNRACPRAQGASVVCCVRGCALDGPGCCKHRRLNHASADVHAGALVRDGRPGDRVAVLDRVRGQ